MNLIICIILQNILGNTIYILQKIIENLEAAHLMSQNDPEYCLDHDASAFLT